MIEIRHHATGDLLYTSKLETLATAVAEAVERRASLAGANLVGANLAGANLAGADLAGANLAGANLAGADLARANLAGADLARANLAGANLAGANLAGADLAGANLAGARGFASERSTDLLILLDQPGAIRAYKLVTASGESPIHGTKLTYSIGQHIEVPAADVDVTKHCGAGINVATLPWCLREWQPGYRVLVVEFTAADIAAIPTATDGKFRLNRCTVVGEKTIDPVALGLVAAPAETVPA